MRKTTNVIFALIIVFIMVLIPAVVVEATAGGFSVFPVMPENQDPETQGFFDLVVRPGQRQELTITVTNTTPEEIRVDIGVVTATTAQSGIIDYGDPGISDETLKHSFADMAEISHEYVDIPGEMETDVTVSFTIPEEGFEGILLGSIVVTREPTQEEIDTSGMIVNRHRHIIAVRMRMNSDEIEPDFQLGEISAALTNHRASIVAEIRNPVPMLFREVLATAQIFPVNSNDAIFEISAPDIAFAPNSIFHFSMVDHEGYGIQAGEYIAKIEVIYEGRTWSFEEKFEILPEEAEEINQASVNQQQQQQQQQRLQGDSETSNEFFGLTIFQISLIGAIFLLLVFTVIVIVVIKKINKKRKREFEEYERKLKDLSRERQLAAEAAAKAATAPRPQAPPSIETPQKPVPPPPPLPVIPPPHPIQKTTIARPKPTPTVIPKPQLISQQKPIIQPKPQQPKPQPPKPTIQPKPQQPKPQPISQQKPIIQPQPPKSQPQQKLKPRPQPQQTPKPTAPRPKPPQPKPKPTVIPKQKPKLKPQPPAPRPQPPSQRNKPTRKRRP